MIGAAADLRGGVWRGGDLLFEGGEAGGSGFGEAGEFSVDSILD